MHGCTTDAALLRHDTTRYLNDIGGPFLLERLHLFFSGIYDCMSNLFLVFVSCAALQAISQERRWQGQAFTVR